MNYIWSTEKRKNDCLVFELRIEKQCDTLEICAVDSFQVFFDDKFVNYGPNRSAAGFIIPKRLNILGVKKLVIKVLSHGVPCYCCDFQDPFFSAMIMLEDKVVYSSNDFVCYREKSRLTNMHRYSYQRGFIEGNDYNLQGVEKVETKSVAAPKVLKVGTNTSEYKKLSFEFETERVFNGFSEVRKPWWKDELMPSDKNKYFDLEEDFLPRACNCFYERNYHLIEEHTGFISLSCNTKEQIEVLIVFDEYLPDDKWVFARSDCNDYIYLKIPAGKTEFISQEPYALKYLKVISSTKDLDIDVNFITYENDCNMCVDVKGNEEIEKVFNAAVNSFRQNAVDLFTDCPGRERAGWLCDSYFSAKAEQLFTGKNDIEKQFLLNYIIADTPEIPKGMLPMCFPSEHWQGLYIPNWAMWFIVELHDYLHRTGDKTLIEESKAKVYDIIKYLDKYINELGLLEDLESWVFIEWSICNSPDYVKGINFPSNMMYAYSLAKAGELYGDSSLIERAKKIQKEVVNLSFNGQFFVDNAIRENGTIVICNDHVSETCQYYALFTGLCPSEEYKEKILHEFGPFRQGKYPEIGKSNVFIGNYLRLFWLCEIGEFERALDESVEYFCMMAEKTGTLWEHDSPVASCCHGFASVIAVIILNCVCGYKGVKGGKVLLDKNRTLSDKYKLEVEFKY